MSEHFQSSLKPNTTFFPNLMNRVDIPTRQFFTVHFNLGPRGGAVEALGYKSEGRGFDSRWYHWNVSLT